MTNRTRRQTSRILYQVEEPEPTNLGLRRDRRDAMRDVSDLGTVVYAIRQKSGLIKIGVTANLARRSKEIGTEVLGFFFGDYEDEQEIHRSLRAHVAKGREYYHETPEVMAVVNDMRRDLGLPLLAA